MARIEKTVFISYRRTDVYTALAVYENLKNQGYDVFFDYRSISSGDFEQIITSNISARAHFILILTPTALDRCNEPGDWLRREIEFAIDERRNIVPLFFRGFRFGDPAVAGKLAGSLQNLNRYNGLNVHEDYFDEAMHRLRTQYLNKPLNTVLHPVSSQVQKVVREEQVAADKALEQIEDVKELVRQADDKPVPLAEPDPIPQLKASASPETAVEKQAEPPPASAPESPIRIDDTQVKPATVLHETAPYSEPVKKEKVSEIDVPQIVPERKVSAPNFNYRLAGGIFGGLLLLGLLTWGGLNLFQNLPAVAAEPTSTIQTNVALLPLSSATITSQPTKTDIPTLTQTSIPTTRTSIPIATKLGIGSSMISEKDGMNLLYVPAGNFIMGSDSGSANEQPARSINLDAFWIDETEVTNAMFAACVKDDVCHKWAGTHTSQKHSDYYDNPMYNNYPVIFVSWDDADEYCKWAGRRLPTETEWEKAARGEDGRLFPWGNDNPNWTNDLLNYTNVVGDTTEVGSFPKGTSPYGALDMAGNVWEWVDAGQYHIIRGGGWNSSEIFTWERNFYALNLPRNFIGFRCAMNATS